MKDNIKQGDECYQEEVSTEEIFAAYFACRKRKRSKPSAVCYEYDYEGRLLALKDALNNGTYRIGQSIVFAVRYPKPREVFAASFEDRIVHHLLINRLLPIIESEFIPDTYNCRRKKGNLYGVLRLRDAIERISRNYTEPYYCLCLDIRGFFMNIDRELLLQKMYRLVDHKYSGNNDFVKWLLRLIITNRPELNCERRGDMKLLDSIPLGKSLLKNGSKGLPIGNLTSQIFANYYLSDFDHAMTERMGADGFFGRYVDDFRFVHRDKQMLLSLIPDVRRMLSEIGLTLHPHKIHIVEVRKGVPFVGFIIKPHRLYIKSRTIQRAFRAVERWNEYLLGVNPSRYNEITELFAERVNCYISLLSHANEYVFKRRLWNKMATEYKARMWAPGNLKTVHVQEKYKTRRRRIAAISNVRRRHHGRGNRRNVDYWDVSS